MPNNDIYVVKNTQGLLCSNCGDRHEFLTLLSTDAPCSTPAAFSRDVANNMARLHARLDDVEKAPSETRVVLHPSARKLPVRGEPELSQYTMTERLQG